MKYLFLSPPATGEMQPTLAVAEALLSEDPTSTIYIGSGSSFQSRYETLISTISSDLEDRLFRIDLGGTDDVEDYSHNMLKKNKNKNPELFQSHRHERGNPIPFFNYWAAFAAGSQSQRIATIQRTLKIINRLKPDMIVVDQIYGTPFDGEYDCIPLLAATSSLDCVRSGRMQWSEILRSSITVAYDCSSACSPLRISSLCCIPSRPCPSLPSNHPALIVDIAVRYSRLPFIMLAPGHPSFAAGTSP